MVILKAYDSGYYIGEAVNLIPSGRGKLVLNTIVLDGEFRDGTFYAGRSVCTNGVK